MKVGRTSARLATWLATLAIAAGCSSSYEDGAEIMAGVQTDAVGPAGRMCPAGEDCVEEPPPLPGDEPPPPDRPPPPPPRDPAKVRFALVPTEFIEASLNLALAGTVVQVSHTTGETLTLPGLKKTCTSEPNQHTDLCLELCNELPVKERAACRAQCDHQTVCTSFCSDSASSAKSFVRWGDGAKALSERTTCTSSTCPACATPTPVPSLTDGALPVPVYQKTIASIPGISYDVQCKMNQWRFVFDARSLTVASTKNGVKVRMPGTTASPSVICNNAPDVDVDDLAIQLTFSFPDYNLKSLRLDAALLGDIDTGAGPIIDYIADIEHRLKDTFAEVAGNRLNAASYKSTYENLFLSLVNHYIAVNGLDPLAATGVIETRPEGLSIQYWTE